MKIGFFTDFYLPSTVGNGVVVSIDIFRRELEKLGHQVYVLCPTKPLKYHDSRRIIRFRSIPGIWFWGYRDTFPYNTRNIKLIEKLGLDIVHIHTPVQIGLLGVYIAKKYKIPLVATYHTDLISYGAIYKRVIVGLALLSLIFPIISKDPAVIKDFFWTLRPTWPLAKWNQRNIKKMITVLHNHCDLVIAPSKKMEGALISYGTKTKIEVIPTGVDIEEVNLLSKSFDFRGQYNIAASSVILLFVGRLGKEKNIDLIVKAMPLIIGEMPNLKLVIVGQGPYRKKLEKLIKKLNLVSHIILTGYISSEAKMAAYKACDIFIFPSLTDTQGLVLNEASLNGKSILFADGKISPLTLNNYNGLKVNNDKSDLAKKVIYLLNHPEILKSFGLNSQKMIENFTAQKQAKKLEKVYQQLLRGFQK
ncbi:MAG: glycosyltransferase [bacterium]|nr:glycosyltransferase [bacterium]